MRVLLGVDGSTPSTVAQHLVESMAWPDGSTIRVVSVVVPPAGVLVGPGGDVYVGPDTLAEVEENRVAHAHSVVEAAERGLRERGFAVETAVLLGAAARELVDDAGAWAADLVVVGSHGHGALAGLLLGSVSAEVVDHAPCPVLIARRPAVTRVVIAVDGSTAAGQAVATLASWPVLRALPTTVLTVIEPLEPMGSAAMPVQASLDVARDRLAAGLRAHAEGVARSAADRLRGAGLSAAWRVVEGKPAEQIVLAAAQEGADLIVVGTLGLTGLARLRLGSTARGVLHTARVSVLVVAAHSDPTPQHRR
jgi:nucleotide-binding universal stress UspA family protein